jgi:pimeloyl-ACP methyl ester carboxylesterase
VSDPGVREGHVEAGGIRIRYHEVGEGPPLVHLTAPRGSSPTPAHRLLARRFRVITLETPGLPPSPPLAATLAAALQSLGLERFDLMATAHEAATALWLALHAPERVLALVLEAPAPVPAVGHEANLERRLPALATPTLVLVGTRDEAAGPASARAYTARLPGAHLVFVYDAGPAVAADRPEAFAEVASDFLERHEAFVISRAATVIHP